MSALSVLAPTIDPTQGSQASSVAELAKRGQIHQTAQKFEASFLTTMYETMFSSVPTDETFGGGQGEDMWKGFLAEAMAKTTASHGGVGVAKSVEREMLKLQGMTDSPTAAQTPATAAPKGASPQAALAHASYAKAAQARLAFTKPAAALQMGAAPQPSPIRRSALQ